MKHETCREGGAPERGGWRSRSARRGRCRWGERRARSDGAGDRRGEIVRNHQLRDAVKEPQRPHVRGAPVRERLGPGGLGEGVVRRPEHGDEDLCFAQLPGGALDDGHALSGVVDEQLLAGAVLLAHHYVELRGPRPVLVAEPAVLQPPGVGRLVLLPHQRQRHVRSTQLAVHLAPLRQRALCRAQHRRGKQPPLQRRIVERLWQRPAQTLLLGAADVLPHRRRRHLQASRYRPGAQTRRVVQPQNLS